MLLEVNKGDAGREVMGNNGALAGSGFSLGELLLQGSELGMRGSDSCIHRLMCGELTEGGKGSSKRLGCGCDIVLGRDGGGLD